MAEIIVHDLDEETLARLSAQARAEGVPVETLARRLLTRGARDLDAVSAMDAIRRSSRPLEPGEADAVSDIRAARDRDHR